LVIDCVIVAKMPAKAITLREQFVDIYTGSVVNVEEIQCY